MSASSSVGAPMPADQVLSREGRLRPRLAVVSGLAGVLLMVGAVIQLSGPHTKVDELTLDLIVANKRFHLDLLAAILNALGSLGVAATLAFLVGATRARNPQTQPYIRIIALLAGALAAISGVIYPVMIAAKAHQFVTTGAQTYQEANHLANGGAILALQLLGQASALLLAVAFVLVSLGAMRVALLTRFMGYLGIFAGVLFLFQITQVPVVQTYWLLAFAYLLSGRWPTGTPPAWTSGRAEKWPSTQELREQRIRASGARGAGGRGKPVPEPVGAPAPSTGPSSNARAGAKRKRKRRK